MRVMVTGAAGFIGSHVVAALNAQDHEVVRIDNLLPKAHGTEATFDGVVGDVRDPALLEDLLAGVDVVCHQAAMVGHGVSPADAPDYVLNNDLGTAVLLSAMHDAGVRRLVLASSMVVYGEGRYLCATHGVVRPAARRQSDLDDGRYDPPCPTCGESLTPGLVPEEAPLDPRSTYAATKAAQEFLSTAWARQTGGAVWALRYHNVYGPGMPRDTPYAGVASLFRSALERGEPPTVLEDGNQRRDFVHVTDVARANTLAMETPAPEGTLVPVNICSGTPHTVGDLATELAKACGGPSPKVVGGSRPGDVRHVVADPTAAREKLGFTARTTFEEGIKAFATAPLRAPAAFV